MSLFSENQEREVQFLYQLGRTLANWQTVEHECYQLYFKIMGGIDQHLISVNWHHIQSFNSRIGLLDHCAYFAFSDVDKAQWKTLRAKIEKAGAVRNQIVHNSYGVEHRGKIATPSLHQSYMDATAIAKGRVHKNRLLDEYRFDLGRLEKHSEEFKSLALAIRKFAEKALAHRSQDA